MMMNWRERQAYRLLLLGECPVCWYCGGQLLPTARSRRQVPTLDHVHPLCDGGMSETANLVLACERCNQRKAERPLSAIVVSRHKGNGVVLRHEAAAHLRKFIALAAGH